MMKKAVIISTLNRYTEFKIFKKIIFIFSLGLLNIIAFSNSHPATKQQIGMFLNSKTCVVLESGISFYNEYIKDAVSKYWKLTDYELINQQEFEKRRFDSKYSFLVLMDIVYDKDPGGISYSNMNLVLGDPSNNMTDMPELCSVPISYTGDKSSDYEYAIPAIVKFMQKHVKALETNRFIISLQGFKYYNKPSMFKDKVLLLDKDKLASDADSPDKIKAVYPYQFELLTGSEILKELSSNPANTLFLFHVGPAEDQAAGKCFEMIFDVDGNLYYYNYRNITNENEDGFNLKDFKNLL